MGLKRYIHYKFETPVRHNIEKKQTHYRMKRLVVHIFCLYLLMTSCISSAQKIADNQFVIHTINLKHQDLQFYLKNDVNSNFGNFKTLKQHLKYKNQKLVFATNGGMYLKDGSPQGLYIENGITKTKIDTTRTAYGNFYLQPNGIFYLTKDNIAVVCKKTDFKSN